MKLAIIKGVEIMNSDFNEIETQAQSNEPPQSSRS